MSSENLCITISDFIILSRDKYVFKSRSNCITTNEVKLQNSFNNIIVILRCYNFSFEQ